MPFRASFDCLWCGTAHTCRSADDLEGWAQLCPACVGKAGDNGFLRFRLRQALTERGAAARASGAARRTRPTRRQTQLTSSRMLGRSPRHARLHTTAGPSASVAQPRRQGLRPPRRPPTSVTRASRTRPDRPLATMTSLPTTRLARPNTTTGISDAAATLVAPSTTRRGMPSWTPRDGGSTRSRSRARSSSSPPGRAGGRRSSPRRASYRSTTRRRRLSIARVSASSRMAYARTSTSATRGPRATDTPTPFLPVSG